MMSMKHSSQVATSKYLIGKSHLHVAGQFAAFLNYTCASSSNIYVSNKYLNNDDICVDLVMPIQEEFDSKRPPECEH